MTDNTELKRLAEAATQGDWQVIETELPCRIGRPHVERRIFTAKDHPQLKAPYPVVNGSVALGTDETPVHHMVSMTAEDAAYIAAANPAAVLALIAENKRLAANVKLNLCDHPAIHQGDVDLLVAFVTGTSQMELAKVHGCTPPNISRKIRRVKERLGWREGMLVSEIRDRAERLRALASQGAFVTADLMSERDQLRAEVAGLKTGYEAYERVNAELKAEVEKLRNAAAPLGPVNGDQLPAINSKVLIHLSSCDAWVEHTVVGYYAWEGLGANEYLHRIFIRVRDADGYLNARLLKDVRTAAAMGQGEQS